MADRMSQKRAGLSRGHLPRDAPLAQSSVRHGTRATSVAFAKGLVGHDPRRFAAGRRRAMPTTASEDSFCWNGEPLNRPCSLARVRRHQGPNSCDRGNLSPFNFTSRPLFCSALFSSLFVRVTKIFCVCRPGPSRFLPPPPVPPHHLPVTRAQIGRDAGVLVLTPPPRHRRQNHAAPRLSHPRCGPRGGRRRQHVPDVALVEKWRATGVRRGQRVSRRWRSGGTGRDSPPIARINPSAHRGEFLQTAAGLSVRWQMQPGNSPDSPGVPAPAAVSISLGFKDSADKPVVLFPPIGNNVPVSALQFSWNPMKFDSFTNGPVPARTANTNWFIVLSDQTTGYKSNGQLFHIVDAGASAAPAPSGAVATASSGIPPGINTIGASTVPSGASAVPSGASAVPSGASAVPSGASAVPSGAPAGASAGPSGAPAGTTQAPSAAPAPATTPAGRPLTSPSRPSGPSQTPASVASSGASFTADSRMFLVAAGTGAALLCTR
ncbi:MAG: hypothetical protein BJ554DRAFT_3075 [Olpidium bornovanus]|uniref:Uncharacterized protein n=1 Tax=Olpidium bornovanus TaxID=278681 RepID=A0A8H7ZPT7_9FUNG|nr:MAG: hypothetical protein BJ554DRAFT_3075 [Olpidium bornovanus]